MRGRSTSVKNASKKEHARMDRKRAIFQDERKGVEDQQQNESKKQRRISITALDRFDKKDF